LQDELLAHALLLSQVGPGLGRPTVDTLKGSKHANMKELRFGWQGEVWRVAFAFDPDRQAILLVGGDKGVSPTPASTCIWPRWQPLLHERKNDMPRNLEQVLAKLPAKRRAKVQQRAAELATLKDLRHAVERTQEELATALGVGQDTISRLEQRSDMLLSTLKRYVEAMGGKLDLVAKFPNRPPVIIEQIAELEANRNSPRAAPASDLPKSSDVARRSTPV
jgi:transcriptional regulator with XRE-family HTH domain